MKIYYYTTGFSIFKKKHGFLTDCNPLDGSTPNDMVRGYYQKKKRRRLCVQCCKEELGNVGRYLLSVIILRSASRKGKNVKCHKSARYKTVQCRTLRRKTTEWKEKKQHEGRKVVCNKFGPHISKLSRREAGARFKTSKKRANICGASALSTGPLKMKTGESYLFLLDTDLDCCETSIKNFTGKLFYKLTHLRGIGSGSHAWCPITTPTCHIPHT